MKKLEISHTLSNIVIPIMVLLIGVLVGKALDILNIYQVAIGVAISIIIVIGIVGIVWKIGFSIHQQEIYGILDSLKKISPSIRYDWLFLSDEIDQIEAKVKCKEIWVVSPDLSNDTGKPDTDISEIVKNNMKRGVNYTFIVPDTNEVLAVLPHLQQISSGNPKRLNVVQVPKDIFRALTMTHIVIYNPNMERGEGQELFWELPTQRRGYNTGTWIRVADDLTKETIGRIKKLIQSKQLY